MALQHIGTSSFTFGFSTAPTCTGISEVTSTTEDDEYGGQAQAKDHTGEVKSVFYYKRIKTGTATGYASSIEAPAIGPSNTLAIGSNNYKIVQSSMQASNQDFAKVSVTGKLIPTTGA